MDIFGELLVTIDYHRLLLVITGSCRLLMVTIGYYSLSLVQGGQCPPCTSVSQVNERLQFFLHTQNAEKKDLWGAQAVCPPGGMRGRHRLEGGDRPGHPPGVEPAQVFPAHRQNPQTSRALKKKPRSTARTPARPWRPW